MLEEADKTAPASGSVEGSPNMEMNARELQTRLASLHGAFMQIGFQYIAEFAMLNENDSARLLSAAAMPRLIFLAKQ